MLVKYKLDLVPLQRGTLPDTAVDDVVAWGIMYLVGKFQKRVRVAVHKKLVDNIERFGRYINTPQLTLPASSMMPPTGAFNIQVVLCRTPPFHSPPPLALWGLARPIYTTLETSMVTAARVRVPFARGRGKGTDGAGVRTGGRSKLAACWCSCCR